MSQISPERTAVLVDQHPLWLDTVEQVVRRADVNVLAKFSSSSAADHALADLAPDLLITGLKMGDAELSGIAMIERMCARQPGVKVIVFSMYEDPENIDAAFSAGADAYVLKTAHQDDLRSAIRQAFQHSIYLAFSRPAPTPRPPTLNDATGLTRREMEILQLVAEGHSNAQLARMLWVTEQTVKFHLSNIYRKLDVSNRTEASRWAQLHGMLASSAGSRTLQATA
jgi:DNA-binding NarL/FixJ family response regulator